MTTQAIKRKARQLKQVPVPKIPQQCASCPFREHNFKEFNAVAERLCEKHGEPKPDFWACLSIREAVKKDAIEGGRLQCHDTVYDEKMNPHPEQSRGCGGLAIHLINFGSTIPEGRQ